MKMLFVFDNKIVKMYIWKHFVDFYNLTVLNIYKEYLKDVKSIYDKLFCFQVFTEDFEIIYLITDPTVGILFQFSRKHSGKRCIKNPVGRIYHNL